MLPFALFRRLGLAVLTAGVIAPAPAGATDAVKGIEQALAAAQADKKGVTLYVQGQQIGGGVVRIEPGQWVEMRSQQYGKIMVRLDRIDGLAQP